MFSKGKHKKATRIDTLIGQHTHITGDISFSGGLRIDGSVTGNISATDDNKSLLTLSEHGSIEGEIRVPNVVINGKINGSVYVSEHVELAPKARIQGNVYYRLLEMAMGSEVNGQMIHARKEDDPSLEHDDDALNVEHEIIDAADNAFQLEQKD